MMRLPRTLLLLIICGFLHPQATELGKGFTRFTIDGKPVFLLGISYYGALGARAEFIQKDLDDMQRDGFNWIRVWATWAAFTNNISTIATNGGPREPFLTRLENLIRECDRRGMIVDVTLSRESGKTFGPQLQRLEDHERAVRTLVERLRPFRNWYLDLGNERNVGDARRVPFEDLRHLREVVRELDAKRLSPPRILRTTRILPTISKNMCVRLKWILFRNIVHEGRGLPRRRLLRRSFTSIV